MRADRLLSIVMLLQSRGKMTSHALAKQLEVSRRTILRDIEALSISGIPVYCDGGHGGGIALDENYRTTLTGLKESELHALFVSNNHQLLAEIGLGTAAESAQRKLTAALPLQQQPRVDHFRQRVYIDPLWWWHDAQPNSFWEDLQEAVFQDRRVEAVYENYNGEISQRLLEPYGLVAKSSLWYLVARHNGTMRTYRVSRLNEVTLLPETFQRDPAFDLVAYWHENLNEFAATFSEYEFTLRIHPDHVKMARWLTPGRNQQLSTDAEGWLTIRFQMERLELARMLVFGLGTHCEVIEPAALREAVKASCSELIEHL